MNILFLTLMVINDFNQTGIYPDLINEFSNNGHDIYVITPCEKKNINQYKALREKDNIHIISAIIPDYYGVGLIKKGISSLFIGDSYLKAIKKNIPNVKFDMVLYSTPPITFCNIIKRIKKRDKAFSYLLLKDIWPQGPIDVGALTTTGIKGLVTKYFKRKETQLYSISDYIGCMSEANCNYLINISGVDKSKIEICPNAIKINSIYTVNKAAVRSEYGLPQNKTIFVYGGNLGIAQGVDFIISCLKDNENCDNSFILIVGSGTEFNKLYSWFKIFQPKNSMLISQLPKEKYLSIMAACDVGLIFLDHRFTIPNIPSRLLSYMEAKMPVLASTDINSDIGNIIEDGNFGYWCESSDTSKFIELLNMFTDDDIRHKMGENSYNYLVNHYNVVDAYKTIIKHLK